MVQKNEKYGMVDYKGKELIPCKYTGVRPIDENLILFNTEEAIYIYNLNTDKLKKIELKSTHSGFASKLPEDKLYFICLVGSLMSSIAHVDNHFDPAEKKALKACLADQFSIKGKELTLLFEVVEEQGRKGFDFHEVVTEINRLTSYNDRLHFMECLFALAAADGQIAHEESEEIRRITKSMRIPHKIYIEAKVRAGKALNKK